MFPSTINPVNPLPLRRSSVSSMQSVLLENYSIRPGKIVCIGRNYVKHITELGNEIPDEMVLFAKPNAAIGSCLATHHGDEPLHYEGELCFLIGGGDFKAVGFGLDLTKRGLQTRLKEKGLPWERAKAFDGAALFSPFAPFDGDLTELRFELHIDGQCRQRGTYAQMIHKPDQILAEVRTFMSLNDNDILMTGTPHGVGTVEPGRAFRGVVFAGDLPMTEGYWTAA